MGKCSAAGLRTCPVHIPACQCILANLPSPAPLPIPLPLHAMPCCRLCMPGSAVPLARHAPTHICQVAQGLQDLACCLCCASTMGRCTCQHCRPLLGGCGTWTARVGRASSGQVRAGQGGGGTGVTARTGKGQNSTGGREAGRAAQHCQLLSGMHSKGGEGLSRTAVEKEGSGCCGTVAAGMCHYREIGPENSAAAGLKFSIRNAMATDPCTAITRLCMVQDRSKLEG